MESAAFFQTPIVGSVVGPQAAYAAEECYVSIMARRAGTSVSRRRRWAIEGLPADGPAPELRSQLQLFGQFVGDWDIVDHRAPLTQAQPPGEVHFNWILGGRAIQDVWGSIDPTTRRFRPWGTTVRYFDRDLGAWRSTWIAPGQHHVRRFVGRKAGPCIVLQEEDRGVRTERWVFTKIRPDSFEWTAWKRSRPRGRWQRIETMRVRRRRVPIRRPE